MEFLKAVPEQLLQYFELGGFVMPPLAIGTLLLWYFLGLRWQLLDRGNRRSCRVLMERYRSGYKRRPKGIIDSATVWGIQLSQLYRGPSLRPALDDAFAEFDSDLGRGKTIVRVIVTAAPLAGLLGTVIGMIETFDSLGDMALFSQSGGIAGGISQALFTTQMGLVVAVPGIVVGRILDRRERFFRDELGQLKNMLCAQGTTQPSADGEELAR
jgi:biopolymer transport protein ExbB